MQLLPLLKRSLKEFTYDDSLTLDHLVIQSASVSASTQKLLNSVVKLEEAIKEINVNEYYGEEELWKSLERIVEVIQKKLRAAGRRLLR